MVGGFGDGTGQQCFGTPRLAPAQPMPGLFNPPHYALQLKFLKYRGRPVVTGLSSMNCLQQRELGRVAEHGSTALGDIGGFRKAVHARKHSAPACKHFDRAGL